MNIKIATAAALGALLFFGLGHFVGSERAGRGPNPGVPGPAVPGVLVNDAALQDQIRRLRAEADQLQADMVRVTATNERLAAPPAPTPAGPRPRSANIGIPVYEQQRAMMNNLRQIDAARAEFLKQKGYAPASVHDLVGLYIRQIRTVGGEDYADLPMQPGQPLSVTAPDGLAVTYDPSGAGTTPIDVPPAVARMEELGKKVQPTMARAMEAFRAANPGKSPAGQQALIPYFATPQEGADYVEYLEAQKAARLK